MLLETLAVTVLRLLYCDCKLFSEREHELIKKAAEELMQKKSREDISKMISSTGNKSSSEARASSQDVS